MKPVNKFIACVGSLALLALGSSSASALSTWDFTGSGGVIGFPGAPASLSATSDDFKNVTIDAFTLLGTATNPNVSVLTQNYVTQDGAGLGVGLLAQDLDATPNSFVTCFNFFGGCGSVGFLDNIEIENAAFDVLRLSLGVEGWIAKGISVSGFEDSESVQLFGGQLDDGSDAVLLADLIGNDATDPDDFLVGAPGAFQYFFIASVAEVGPCDGLGLGFCGTPSSVRIASFTGQQVPEPGALALLGAGLVGMAMVRRRRKIAA